jgi:aminomethyltransferase
MKMPTHEWHQKKGALFEEFFGCEIPSHYGAIQDEYWALRKTAAVRDVSYFGKVRVSGRDRRRFLNGMISNEVKSVEPGMGIWALFLDVKGHVQADMKVYALEDHLLLVMQHYVRDKLISGLDRYIISEDVTMTDVTEQLALLQVLGPKAETVLREKGVDTFPSSLYSFSSISLAGVAAHLIRLSVGFALLTPAPGAAAVLDHLDLPLVGMRAFDVFRVESGLPLVQVDIEESNFPQEAHLDAALNFQKGCYLGQEVMARIDAQGHVNRHMMGIASASELRKGDKIYKDGREVGKIMSTTTSLLLNQPFALSYVRREYSKEGESVEIGDNRTTGIVKELPLKL